MLSGSSGLEPIVAQRCQPWEPEARPTDEAVDKNQAEGFK